ncbi:FAD-binding oxidoreductase [Brevibacterium yomogidense]|uniref:FAD-binding oxidoreductase n=1 Tax=Brevibacterium yomogidense TaxID=946573 RepID=UPI0018E0133A|nr:FAD-linked oxidase C-terminal domain-containing protein [Brevibacterium yomogidense]
MTTHQAHAVPSGTVPNATDAPNALNATDVPTPPLTSADVAVDLAPLAAVLSDRALVDDLDVIAAHSKDRAVFAPIGAPRALIRARNVSDVQETLRFAHEHRLPVIPQGALTGLSGGANGVDGALLLNVAGMDRIVDIDTVEQTATVEPGVLNRALKDALVEHGLSYPPDPGSVDISTLGGNVATNAGGLCCVKYGVTKDYVRRLTVVLADGSLTTVGRPTAKGVAGLDLASLFVGSEGTLGVVVEIVVELIPAIPDPLTGVALFDDIRDAARTITEFMSSGVTPSMLEILDGTSIACINDYGDFGLPEGAAAMLLVQSNGDGSLERATADLTLFERIAAGQGATEVTISDDPDDSEMFIAARRSVGHALEKYAMAHGGGELVDDVCLPRKSLAEFFTRMQAIADEHDVMLAVVGHAGDGNMHPNVLFDVQDPASVARANAAFEAIMATGLELGGTITGEHGVGVLKQRWLAQELDPVAQRLHLAIKREFDSRGILSPGKMLGALAE